MLYTSESLERLISELSKLPGVGRKTAQRLAFYILKQPRDEISMLVRALENVKDRITNCSVCFNITEPDPCIICSNEKRDPGSICVVEEPNDVLAIEKTNGFKGRYHVLGGVISPLDGVGPNDLRIKELLARIDDGVKEIILAVNPNVEGDATISYLIEKLRPFRVVVTRIARGIPIGGDLEYADEITLTRAFEGRMTV